MKYALLGDLHSSVDDTKAVLKHIEQTAPDARIIGLGDLYECLVGEKKALTKRDMPLKEAAIVSKKFEKLLTFPSIRGNQEERISVVTGMKKFMHYPETMHIQDALLMHGHQFEWTDEWEPLFPEIDEPLLFFGHSHESALYRGRQRYRITFHEPIYVGGVQYAVNVGAVVGDREWCLYDADLKTITFMKAE